MRAGRAQPSRGVGTVVVWLLRAVTTVSVVCELRSTSSATHRCSPLLPPNALLFATTLKKLGVRTSPVPIRREGNIPYYHVDTNAGDCRAAATNTREEELTHRLWTGARHCRSFKATAPKLVCAAPILFAASFLAFGSRTPPAHAAASSHRLVQRASSSIGTDDETAAPKHIHQYMFNDNKFNPLETAHRESVANSSPSPTTHPRLSHHHSLSKLLDRIKGTASSTTLGLTAHPHETKHDNDNDTISKPRVVRYATKFVNDLQIQLGLSKIVSYLALMILVGVVPFLVLNTIGFVFGRAQRSTTHKKMATKDRRHGQNHVDSDAAENVSGDNDEKE